MNAKHDSVTLNIFKCGNYMKYIFIYNMYITVQFAPGFVYLNNHADVDYV